MKIYNFGASRRAGKTTWLIEKIKAFATDDFEDEQNFLFVTINKSLKNSTKDVMIRAHGFKYQRNNNIFKLRYKNVNVAVVSKHELGWQFGYKYDKAFLDNVEYMSDYLKYQLIPVITDEVYTTQTGEIERDYLMEFMEDDNE